MTSSHTHKLPLGIVTAALAVIVGCGGRPSPETTQESAGDLGQQRQPETGGALAVDGLRGTIPKEDVIRVFDRHMDKLLDCYSLALEELEEIEGEIALSLQVDASGRVGQVHITKSDLGSLEAEQCIVGRVTNYTFPEPAGGGTAEVSYSMIFEAPYDNPPPLKWEPSVVDAVLIEHDSAVERCIGNRTGIQITSYVGRGGVVLTTGVAARLGKDIEAGRCLAEDMRGWEFPDPGRKLAKVELSF